MWDYIFFSRLVVTSKLDTQGKDVYIHVFFGHNSHPKTLCVVGAIDFAISRAYNKINILKG